MMKKDGSNTCDNGRLNGKDDAIPHDGGDPEGDDDDDDNNYDDVDEYV